MQLKKSQETEPGSGGCSHTVLLQQGLLRAGENGDLHFWKQMKPEKVILELKIWDWRVGGGSGERGISSWLEETPRGVGEVLEMRGRAGDAPGAGGAHWGEQESRSEGRAGSSSGVRQSQSPGLAFAR